MPHFDAPPIPAKKLNGTDITSAHGQDITRNVSARSIQMLNAVPVKTGGIVASSNAPNTTTGV